MGLRRAIAVLRCRGGGVHSISGGLHRSASERRATFLTLPFVTINGKVRRMPTGYDMRI
jgi:hypothetical protein